MRCQAGAWQRGIVCVPCDASMFVEAQPGFDRVADGIKCADSPDPVVIDRHARFMSVSGSHECRQTTRRGTGLKVAFAIANHQRLREIQPQFLRGAGQHAWHRFAAVTVGLVVA